MDVYPVRMTAAHAIEARKLGKGNLSEGVRMLIEQEKAGFIERRSGKDRRRK